jgi:hypothetical protein
LSTLLFDYDYDSEKKVTMFFAEYPNPPPEAFWLSDYRPPPATIAGCQPEDNKADVAGCTMNPLVS